MRKNTDILYENTKMDLVSMENGNRDATYCQKVI